MPSGDKGKRPLADSDHTTTVDFACDGNGYGKGGKFTLHIDGQEAGKARGSATSPAFFSIDDVLHPDI